MRTRALVAAALAVTIAIAIAFVALRNAALRNAAHGDAAPNAEAFAGTPVLPAKLARDFVLRDGAGRAVHLLDPRAAVTMLFFGYTHCPDECPLALSSLGHAYRSLAPVAAARTRIVFVTVDPARDTPHAVAVFVKTFDPHIVGLTGTRAELARVWDAYGVHVDPDTHGRGTGANTGTGTGTGTGNSVGHGDAVYAIDASARVRFVYTPDTSAADFASDLATLAR